MSRHNEITIDRENVYTYNDVLSPQLVCGSYSRLNVPETVVTDFETVSFLHNQYIKSEIKLILRKRVRDLCLNPTPSPPSSLSQIHLLPSLLTRLHLIPQARSSNTQQNSMEVKIKLCLLTDAAHLRLTTLVTPETLDVK